MTAEPNGGSPNGEDAATEYEKLRALLVGPEQTRLEALTDELRLRAVRVEDIAGKLPEAIALRTSRDDQIGRALSPTIDIALRDSIRRDPREMASAIYPILGPAIRKAIAEAMSGLVRSINQAVEQSLSVQGMRWRIEALRSGVPYPEVVLKHALVYRVEQAFLVHSETGLLLQHVAAADLHLTEPELVSSMLSAIQDFVRDSFRPDEGAMLRTFSVGEHTIHLEAGPRALLAIVIRGQAPDEVLTRQQDTLETVHLEFASQLAEFSGDSTGFLRARPLLEDCLETVLTTSQRSKRRFMWLRWAVPLFLVVAAGVALFVISSIRWNRAVDAIRREPGLVVIDADRKWPGWRISGLKDPDARDVRAVLSAVGVKTRNLSGDWEGYLSLDAEIVERRARRAVDSIGSLLERERILFDPGSAELSQDAVGSLTRAAGLTRTLDAHAASLRQEVHLNLTGRTDPSGADSTNSSLAQRRVDAVAAFLESAGIPPARLVRTPLATGRPLPAPDAITQARLNRSVSFEIVMQAPSSAGGGG